MLNIQDSCINVFYTGGIEKYNIEGFHRKESAKINTLIRILKSNETYETTKKQLLLKIDGEC